MAGDGKKQVAGAPPVISNRKAFHDYTIVEELETGIVLEGAEVKSVRAGGFQFSDAYVEVRDGQLWLVGSTIPPYKQASTHREVDPARRRKLLAHSREISRLKRKVQEKNFTIVPLKAYFNQGRVKVLIALVRGKKEYDKRDTIKARDTQREVERTTARGRM